jgi:hypothetical protein
MTMARKRIASKLPTKSVAKAVVVGSTSEQLSLDFERHTVAGEKTAKIRAKAPKIRNVPAAIDIPEKPKG